MVEARLKAANERAVPWWNDPLMHFALLALVLFWVIRPSVDSQIDDSQQEGQQLVVPKGLRDDINQQFLSQYERLPDPGEAQALVDEWLDSELLYRQGLQMGLDKKDPTVREQIIKRTETIFKKSAATQDPSEQQLLDYFQAHQTQYQPPQRIDFDQITLRRKAESQAQAQTLLQNLKSGINPAETGYQFHQFVQRNANSLAARYGDAFVYQLFQAPPQQWQLLSSSSAWHLVRVQAIHGDELPAFNDVARLVKVDWQRDQERTALTQLVNELRAQYTLIDEQAP